MHNMYIHSSTHTIMYMPIYTCTVHMYIDTYIQPNSPLSSIIIITGLPPIVLPFKLLTAFLPSPALEYDNETIPMKILVLGFL